MFMLLDLTGHGSFYWHHYQVQTIMTCKMLAIACKAILYTYFVMNILVWCCTHLHERKRKRKNHTGSENHSPHDIAKAGRIDNASIPRMHLLNCIVSPTHNAYVGTETNTQKGNKFCK